MTTDPPEQKSPIRRSGNIPASLAALVEGREVPPVCLISSPDEIRSRRAVEFLINHFSPTGQHQISRYRAPDLSLEPLSALIDSTAALSLFTQQEFFWIRNLESCPAPTLKHIPRLLERASPSHAVIFTSTSLPQTHPIQKYCLQKKTLVVLDELKGFELQRWTERELRRLGFTAVPDDAIVTLLHAADASPDRIAAMAEHLWLYSDSPSLTRADVEALFAVHTVPGEFEFIDSLVSGNVARSELMSSSLLRGGKNPFLLLSLLNRSFSSYLTIKALLSEGLSPQEVRQRLGTSPWAFNKQLPIAQRYSLGELRRCMRTLMVIDGKFKNRSLGPELLMSELIRGVRREARA